MPTTPTRRKRRLGALLEGLRLDAGKLLDDAAALLRVTDATVSRYETGHVRPSWTALVALLGMYGATDDQRAEAAALWEDAGLPATKVVTPAGSSRAFRALLRAETEAATVRTLVPQAVPGLLQTEGYARAVQAVGQQFHMSDRPQRYVSARLSRQARLTGPTPFHLHAVVDEAVVLREVGGPEVMAEQLRHLIDVAGRDNVTVQVVPYRAGAYGTMSSGFTLIGYPDDDAAAVYIDHAAGGAWVENEEDVKRFETSFADAAKAALSPGKSVALIKAQVRALEKQ